MSTALVGAAAFVSVSPIPNEVGPGFVPFLIAIPVVVLSVIVVALTRGMRRLGLGASLVAGALGLPGLGLGIFSPMAYDTGPGRTEWIETLGISVPGLVQIAALLAVVTGWVALGQRTQRGTSVGLKIVLIASWVGSMALIATFVLISYDVG